MPLPLLLLLLLLLLLEDEDALATGAVVHSPEAMADLLFVRGIILLLSIADKSSATITGTSSSFALSLSLSSSSSEWDFLAFFFLLLESGLEGSRLPGIYGIIEN